MSIDIDDLRARIGTDLDDTTLQRILDSAEKAIERAAGNATSEIETKEAFGAQFFTLDRRSTAFTSITERRRYSSDAVTLSANDYRKVGDYKLMRLADGDNPSNFWGSEVVITYTPEVDTDVRDRVALDLCQVDIEFRAYDREKSPDWEGEQKDWKARRRELLTHVKEGRSPII